MAAGVRIHSPTRRENNRKYYMKRMKRPACLILSVMQLTSPIEPAPVCRFAKRCSCCVEACSQKEPEWIEVTPGHFVSCFLVNNR